MTYRGDINALNEPNRVDRVIAHAISNEPRIFVKDPL